MKTIQHLIEYSFLVLLALVVRIMPLEFNRFIARRLADFVFFILPIRKIVVLTNLRESFGSSKSEREIHQIARKTYQQFAQTMIELLYFPNLGKKEIEELVHIENLPLLDAAYKMGKGAVFVGAHFGNWELMGAALAQHYPVSLVVGQQENILVDNLLNSFRLQKGTKILPLKLALRGVLKALKNKEFVAILADQDAHQDGVFVDFFGRPASTPKGPALFSLRANCPLISGHIFRENKRFKVIFEIVPKPEPTGNEEKDIELYTQEQTKILENYCRKYPDHWFWMHRRWKTAR